MGIGMAQVRLLFTGVEEIDRRRTQHKRWVQPNRSKWTNLSWLAERVDAKRDRSHQGLRSQSRHGQTIGLANGRQHVRAQVVLVLIKPGMSTSPSPSMSARLEAAEKTSCSESPG